MPQVIFWRDEEEEEKKKKKEEPQQQQLFLSIDVKANPDKALTALSILERRLKHDGSLLRTIFALENRLQRDCCFFAPLLHVKLMGEKKVFYFLLPSLVPVRKRKPVRLDEQVKQLFFTSYRECRNDAPSILQSTPYKETDRQALIEHLVRLSAPRKTVSNGVFLTAECPAIHNQWLQVLRSTAGTAWNLESAQCSWRRAPSPRTAKAISDQRYR